jgi:Predicted flavin-nucleotide-binding protein
MHENMTAHQHPHGTMRRKEREITDKKEIDEIIDTGKVMHLALSDNNLPFLIPVFYTYDGTSLYFHSAKAGTKIDIMKKTTMFVLKYLSITELWKVIWLVILKPGTEL